MTEESIASSRVTACVCVSCGVPIFSVPDHVPDAKCLDCARGAAGADWAIGTPLGAWHATFDPFLRRIWADPDAEMAEFCPAEYEVGTDLTPFAKVDPDTELRCITCGEIWPQILGLADSGRVRAFRDHDRVAHQSDAWLIGGPGGADEPVCAPCGGSDREKRNLPDGPDHSKCRKGKTSGWGGRCGCLHRSRAEIDQIAGKNDENGRKWRPKRWSDPEIVEIAAENVQNRWNQLNLWEEGPLDA